MYAEDAVKRILFNPLSSGANQLCILTAHATPGMVSWLLKSYDECSITGISVELIIGMAVSEGISTLLHEGFKELHGKRYMSSSGSFSCSYIYQNPPVRENLYIWLKDDVPVFAFSGSFEFTQTSLLRKQHTQILEFSAADAYQTYEAAVSRSVYCNFSEIEEDIVIYHSSISDCLDSTSIISANKVRLSLLINKGTETGKRSGLNWGQRNSRNRNEAYIPLPSKVAKSGFFPLNKQHFIALTDDHRALLLRVEQQNDKAITTPASNAQLGEYFRNRLGMPNGAFIRKEDLIKYGRTDVTFYKIDDEQFYMDFSVSTEL